jgi:SLBB domain
MGSGGQGGVQQSQVDAVDRDLIARLRQMQATGRIVLELQPQSAGESSLPNISLEDGDRLVVPSIPATVQVIGAVFNQNAFLYRDSGRVGDYLRMAGGPTRDADRGQAFVLRADGSVVSRGAKGPVFASGFDKQRLYPGDTVVIPGKGVRVGAMRGFLNWAQVFSQLALGAAAISVVK